MDRRPGIVPVPVLGLLFVVLTGRLSTGTLPSDMLVNIAMLSAGGFACAFAGQAMPACRSSGRRRS